MLTAVRKKLTSTKTKVSKEWTKYRKTKTKVLHRKNITRDEKRQILESERDLTRQRIRSDWSMYRETKYAMTHESPYRDFMFIKKMVGSRFKPEGYDKPEYFRFHKTYQKIYKAKRGFNPDRLDTIILELLEQSNVRGVLVVFEVELADTEQTTMVSQFLQIGDIRRIEELNRTIFEDVAMKFFAKGGYAGNLKFVYMRVIYANTK